MVLLIQRILKHLLLFLNNKSRNGRSTINSWTSYSYKKVIILPSMSLPGMEITIPSNMIWINTMWLIQFLLIILTLQFLRFLLFNPKNKELQYVTLLFLKSAGWWQKIRLDLLTIIEIQWVSLWGIFREFTMPREKDSDQGAQVYTHHLLLMDQILKLIIMLLIKISSLLSTQILWVLCLKLA